MNYNAITVTRNKAAHESTFVTQTVKKYAVTLELCVQSIDMNFPISHPINPERKRQKRMDKIHKFNLLPALLVINRSTIFRRFLNDWRCATF